MKKVFVYIALSDSHKVRKAENEIKANLNLYLDLHFDLYLDLDFHFVFVFRFIFVFLFVFVFVFVFVFGFGFILGRAGQFLWQQVRAMNLPESNFVPKIIPRPRMHFRCY